MSMHEHEFFIRSIEQANRVGTTFWHVNTHFLVQKERRTVKYILRQRGLSWVDFTTLPQEYKQTIAYREKTIGEREIVTFPPGKLVLGQTEEDDISVPDDRQYRMRPYFVHGVTGETLPLRTNLTAPLIQPRASGPQTYEFYNVSPYPLAVSVASLVCVVDILALTSAADTVVERNGNFPIQAKGKIVLGEIMYRDLH